MLNGDRILRLERAIGSVVSQEIPGEVVECGTYKGGGMMIMLHRLCRLNDRSRDIRIFDTFEGMPQPGKWDRKAKQRGVVAWRDSWNKCSLEKVTENVFSIGYPAKKIRFIKGLVEKTLPAEAPTAISVLHLDMDFYEPTLHALKCLFSLISKGGYLIIDDYGAWQGCRRAVDEYFGENYKKSKGDWSQRIIKKGGD